MKITFHGAVRTVTGSMHLVETNGTRIIFDCGLFQGRRREARKINAKFPFDPASIDVMILSHAHIDHSGRLPMLVKEGFRGDIYATPATRDLCSVMLADSAYIQQKEAEYLSRKRRDYVEPLYDKEDVNHALQRFISIPKGREFRIRDGIKGRFYEAGHMLGSAGIVIEAQENGRAVRLGYSGDVGHVDDPLLNPLEGLPYLDALIMESTYGNVCHMPRETRTAQLLEIVRDTHARGGKVIIPAFSVGRTQVIVHNLHQLFDAGTLPAMPIYVDSPLAVNATEVFRLHLEELRPRLRAHLEEAGDDDPYGFRRLRYIRDVKDSIALNTKRESCVIISASGMCEHGRILHHLKNNITSDRNTVLIVGYQAEHTLGRRLLDGETEARILGRTYPVRAKVAVLNGFSAHADQTELIAFVRASNGHGELGQIYLVHGGETRGTALAKAIEREGLPPARLPMPGETVTVK